jgi:protoporphyrinogen oxidase
MKTAVIIGAGPAGLTAAYELLTRAGIRPIVLEQDDCVGGISRTVNYKGNRIDIGGHRFFSKSNRVMKWWAAQLELMLRPRRSRIFFLRQFFDYPLRLSLDTLVKLGLARTIRIGLSYLRASLFPIRDERTLEDFFINRFGRELYLTFFKSYTEKVWGVPCRQINAAWGAQRIKGLSVWKSLLHAFKKSGETSLIDEFLYPMYGPGQMWEHVAAQVTAKGGTLLTHRRASGLAISGSRATSVTATHTVTGATETFQADYVFSTMPVSDLVRALDPPPPQNVREVAAGLVYRDFITVGLLLGRIRFPLPDNWIYIQEPDVRVGRLQIFNNWSPHMVADPSRIWLGMEYFCNQGDDLWTLPDGAMIDLAADELSRLGFIHPADVLDATVIRMEKAYPAYFGAYQRFQEIRDYLDGIENLYPIGRNGMHRYNNQDHSMLAAMTAVDQILAGDSNKSPLWDVNTEQEYHEDK